MTFDPVTTGEAPISWSQGPPPPGAPGSDRAVGEIERTLGIDGGELRDVIWLPDDPDRIRARLAEDDRPFHGAHVPLVVHDPLLSERSYDAAEWAAELIAGAGGKVLGVVPYAEKEWLADTPLSPRQWNHTAAMIERLDELCIRLRVEAAVAETIGDDPARDDGTPNPERPLHFAIDAGSFVADGYVPARLISPEKVVAEANLTDRLRDFLRNRT